MDAAEKYRLYISFGGPGIYLNLYKDKGYKKTWQKAHDKAIRKINHILNKRKMSIDEKIKLIDSLTRILHECNSRVDSKAKALYEEVSEKLRTLISQLEL